ncbi:MAG: hypothetical protein D6727_07440 [Gammaproteobacteria bacterium]|nr:MAG: hypothetical protein D6727_07440 [Gammaproteobacteria bacterium]
MAQAVTGAGAWLVQRRALRVLAIAVLFPFGLLSLLSGALVVMVTMLRGWREAGADCVLALLALTALVAAAGGSWPVLAGGAALSWGLALVLGATAARYRTLTLPLQLLVLLGTAAVLLAPLLLGDVVAFWAPRLEALARALGEAGIEVGEPAAFRLLAPLMTGLVAASAVLSSSIALLLGAWFAARTMGQAFAPWFLQLRMGAVLGILAAAAGIAAGLELGWLADALVLVLGTGFALQGLAVLHWQVSVRGWPGPLLVLVYLPLLLGPVAMALAWMAYAAIGFIDNAFGLRRGGTDMLK